MALFHEPDDVEAAIAELSLNGFTEKDVSVVIFEAAPPPKIRGSGLAGWLARGGFFGDTIDRSDGISRMDGIGVGAMIGCLLGVVFGSQWRFGPVATGTAGLLLGGLIGLMVDRLIPEQGYERRESGVVDGLMLVKVSIPSSKQPHSIKQLLERNGANQLAVVKDGG
jgi:hypothetical protein